jgi:hypothetical protein
MHASNRLTAALLAATALAAAAPPASAAIRYADPASTDQVGSCSSLQPCRLDHAVGGAAADDVVVVRPGSYDVSYAVSASEAITVRGLAGQPRPLLKGSGSTAVLDMSDGGAVRHLRLESSGGVEPALVIEGVAARDLDIFTTAGTGADVRDSSRGTVLADSVVRATGAEPAIETKDGKTDGPLELLGVTLYAPDSSATAVKVKQAGASGTLIRNAIIRGGAGDVKVYRGAIGTVDHSNFRAAASTGFVDGGANQDGDPLFADAAAGDLHPLPGSPVIDAGTGADDNLGPADLDGFRRTIGTAPDLGGFEFVPPGTADAVAPLEPDPADSDPPTTFGDHGNDPAIDPPAPPKPGKRMGVEPVKGAVRVKPPGSEDFVDLDDAASIPVGSTVDARQGVVELTTARDASGEPQTGRFWGGRFKVTQRAETGQYTDLELVGGNFSACGAHAKVSAAGRRGVRQLWGRDHHGRFRTRGRGAQATVRGTHWLTRDRCDGTLFKVKKGAIDVKPNGKRRSVRVRAGERFLAKLPR